MFGYTTPAYGRLSPTDNRTYRRYYCEGCHQLRDGYGLTGTGTVNYDMTFNTILLEGLVCDCPDFGPTTRRICVLDSPKADSRLMREMAAYTLILTKWELYDDETDMPSMKTKLISLTLNRAIQKAVSEFPEYDRMVGEGFMRLRDMELAGCRDALSMGREFGRGLTGPLEGIAGDFYTKDLGDVFPVDSQMLSSGLALLAIEGAECRDKGMGAQEIAEHLRSLTGKVDTSFVLDTLEYMWKGGRCSAVTSLGANLLKLKPALEMKDGKLGVYKKYRGAIETVYKQYVKERLAGKQVRPGHVFITNSGEIAPEIIQQLDELVRELIPVQEIHHSIAGCTISSHCGPKTLGILFINE